MSPELGIQLADIGLKTIDGLGNIWADKFNREKKAKEMREVNELREAYAERVNGPGSGGGTAAGHLGEVDYLNYFMPAIQSVATTGYYQLANHIGNKAYEAYLKKKKPAHEKDAIQRPVSNGDVETEDLNKTIADSPDIDAGILASNDHQSWFQTMGMYPTASPVGKTSQNFYIAGTDPMLKIFGIDVDNGISLMKKGTKLIPRQK